ncbi:hypothetical protein ACFOUP_12825 [Belliella kenyensis]|uniref:DUF3945 domain-containing protein n=1 Tax=Belliella kenyensis TaxID=1472724 RepID=A0ABV8ELT0_9BACT|nr:hypothetical protein [Belliella kenyensis]MCH7400857.1 hypothetical protein [Belliella kenyensis]MDN3601856.1 hypothetical protein [Belliella kenyensis]
MDQENLEYLKERLKYAGFEDKLNTALENQIKKGETAFELPIRMNFEEKNMDFNLHFNQSSQNERFFFNKMDVILHNPNPSIPYKEHTFYQNQGVTAKEAFNLIEGRAVEKSLLNAENEPYKAWLQLDLSVKEENGNFKLNQYHENYGFDLKKVLHELPIKELHDENKMEWMLKAVAKGNVYPVTMEKDGKEEIMFIEANPKFKAVNVYDSQMRTVKTNTLKLDQAGNDLEDSKKKVLNKQEMRDNKVAPKLPTTPRAPKASKGRKV